MAMVSERPAWALPSPFAFRLSRFEGGQDVAFCTQTCNTFPSWATVSVEKTHCNQYRGHLHRVIGAWKLERETALFACERAELTCEILNTPEGATVKNRF